MKKILLLLAFAGLCIFNADAQKKVPDTHKTCNEQTYRRTEIILPQVNGFNSYKADLHVHTIYSDGDITPRQRVREAWYDGLDIIALTDHLEARNYEKYMLKALAPHNPDGKPHKYYHAGSVRLMEDGTDPGIRSNHNATFAEAEEFEFLDSNRDRNCFYDHYCLKWQGSVEDVVLQPGETDGVMWATFSQVHGMIRRGEICHIIGRQFYEEEPKLLNRQSAQ